ncbi:MAG: DUF2934 domain-containing protein [Rariglobus sp.]
MSTRSLKKIQDNELEDEIARLAYELWAQDGYIHGNHGKHWLEAERQLRGAQVRGENSATPFPDDRATQINQNDSQRLDATPLIEKTKRRKAS